MVRISDILKKAKTKKETRAHPPSRDEKKVPAKADYKGTFVSMSPKKKEAEAKVFPKATEGVKGASSEETAKLYEETAALMRGILRKDADHKTIEINKVAGQVEKIVDQLILGNEEILTLAFEKDSKSENYLLCHSVNVSVFSMEIGLGLNYDKNQLIELGISALFHDIGMIKYMHLADQPKKLASEEFAKIKEHPLEGSEILEKIKDMKKVVLRVIQQEHERVDGSGYPRGLEKDSITEYAQVVSLADTYEAMIHQRAYRDEFPPLEAMRKIISNKASFGDKLIKILLERVGLFPIGSFVELNTQEIVQVVKLNRDVPVRPIVKVVYEADGDKPRETKIIDLTTHHAIYIKRALRKSELEAARRKPRRK